MRGNRASVKLDSVKQNTPEVFFFIRGYYREEEISRNTVCFPRNSAALHRAWYDIRAMSLLGEAERQEDYVMADTDPVRLKRHMMRTGALRRCASPSRWPPGDAAVRALQVPGALREACDSTKDGCLLKPIFAGAISGQHGWL